MRAFSLNAQERLQRLVAETQIVQAGTQHHDDRAGEAKDTENLLMRWAQHSETVRDTCNKQSRVCSVDPSSRSSIQLSKEEQHEREGSVLEEVCMRTHGTLNLFVVCGLACIQNTGAKTLVPYVSRQVRVVAGEKSRVGKRGL